MVLTALRNSHTWTVVCSQPNQQVCSWLWSVRAGRSSVLGQEGSRGEDRGREEGPEDNSSHPLKVAEQRPETGRQGSGWQETERRRQHATHAGGFGATGHGVSSMAGFLTYLRREETFFKKLKSTKLNKTPSSGINPSARLDFQVTFPVLSTNLPHPFASVSGTWSHPESNQ